MNDTDLDSRSPARRRHNPGAHGCQEYWRRVRRQRHIELHGHEQDVPEMRRIGWASELAWAKPFLRKRPLAPNGPCHPIDPQSARQRRLEQWLHEALNGNTVKGGLGWGSAVGCVRGAFKR